MLWAKWVMGRTKELLPDLHVGNYLPPELLNGRAKMWVAMSSSLYCLGRDREGIFANSSGVWGHQESTTCLRDSPCWPSFSATTPDTALQSTTLITWWHTKQSWCKVELTEQQRKGSASCWAVWGIHSRWLQPSQCSDSPSLHKEGCE